MAIDRSEYTIAIKTTAEVEAAKSANNALLELTKTAGKTREGMDEAGASAHELHERFHLVKLAAGEALGPLAELGHFLRSPELLGAAVATLGVQQLIERLHEGEEEMRKSLEAGQAYQDFLVENHTKAILDAAAATRQFSLELERARQSVDQLAKAQALQISLAQEHLALTNDLTNAQERQAVALTHLQEVQGRITSVTATAEEHRIHEAAQHARDAAEDAEKQGDIETKRHTQAGYAQEQTAAESALAGLQGPRRAMFERTGRAAQNTADAKKAADEATQAATEARAKAMSAPTLTEVGQAIAQGLSGEELRREREKDASQKEAAAATARKTLESAVKHEAAIAAESKELDDSISVQQELIKSRRELIEKLKAETEQAATSLLTHQQSRATVEAVDRSTYNATRQATLLQRQQSGQITNDESAELEGMSGNLASSPNRAGGTRIPGLVENARTVIRGLQRDRSFGTGHASAEDVAEMARLLAEFIGMANNPQIGIGTLRQQINELSAAVAQLNAANIYGRWQGTN